MNDFNPKDKSKGLGDTIAKITHATGLDKVADAVAKASGAEDCGCNKRRKTLNKIFPYTKKTEIKKPHINTKPLLTLHGKYEVLQEIHCTLPTLGKTTFTKGTILLIDDLHPLYKDIPFYYKNNIVKKL
jgi:hypothetical protein|tara:strand:+ start:355 stop:741 length:387 start_codon:yes stop_codon:yes gene_type:complete